MYGWHLTIKLIDGETIAAIWTDAICRRLISM